MRATKRILPRRIILVRHGENEGNVSDAAYCSTPDHQIPLTEAGIIHAQDAGEKIHQIIYSSANVNGSPDPGADGSSPVVYFYVSPYKRTTRSTLSEIGKSFRRSEIAGAREECRIREQDFGNFQEEHAMNVSKERRERFGTFFYRFHEGESGADVYDRVAGFIESLWRDIDMNRINRDENPNFNVVIVSHGITCKIFLMKWFKWTVHQFEKLRNLTNGEVRVMELGQGGEHYSLCGHHTEKELEGWGLSREMIANQQWRATADTGAWNLKRLNYLDDFFTEFKYEGSTSKLGDEE